MHKANNMLEYFIYQGIDLFKIFLKVCKYLFIFINFLCILGLSGVLLLSIMLIVFLVNMTVIVSYVLDNIADSLFSLYTNMKIAYKRHIQNIKR